MSGAEAAADEVIAKLRDSGVEPKQINYGRIVDEIEKGVLKGGLPVDKVKDSVFELERKRIDAETIDPTPPREETRPKDPLPEENGPSGEGKPSEKDPIDPSDSGSEGKPQSHDLGTGTDAGDDDLENASPEAKTFMKNLLEPGDTVDEIMMKKPEDLTEGEVREIMIARMDATTEDERERLFKAEKGFFDHFFGNEPAGTDAVGRTMEPKPIRPIPEIPKPIATADGEPLQDGLKRIGRKVVRDARDDGLASVIKRLQGGLNLLGEAKAPKDGAAPLEQLKQDGVFGPKSRSGLRRAVTTLGVPKVEEGLALARFGEFARDGRKQGFEILRVATEKSFATLFRNPAKPVRRPADRVENVTLQETLNDLGRSHFGNGKFASLKTDGDIGPRTTETFAQLTSALGPERVTKRFGEFLGFF
ncbi:MAG: hypothetical protein IH994_07165 [Proteobacteria bacterium]|nr:hypothetical protein [Pseudomonadota bacterium]